MLGERLFDVEGAFLVNQHKKLLVFCAIFISTLPISASAQIHRATVKDSGETSYTILLHCDPQDKNDKRWIGALVDEAARPDHPIRTFDPSNLMDGKKFNTQFGNDTFFGLTTAEPSRADMGEFFVVVSTEMAVPETEMNFIGSFFQKVTTQNKGNIKLFCVLASSNISMDSLEVKLFGHESP